MTVKERDAADHLASAKRVFELEAQAVADLANRLDGNFSSAVEYILHFGGRTIVCGMGKSGIVGRKISATMASTGTPSFFMHPGEAYHGDLGMVVPSDAFIAISYSGETDEVVKLLPFLRDNGNFLIAMTGNCNSTLARAATCHLDISVKKEACPLHLAPTSSTTATLVMGDALAVALMEARGFKPEHFARFHPGGSLGRRLLSRVEHEMAVSDLPVISEDAKIVEVIHAITRSKLGLAVFCGKDGAWSVITDGDLRRGLERYGRDIFDYQARDLATRHPAGVPVGTRVEDALELMERKKISALLVYDKENLVGIFKK